MNKSLDYITTKYKQFDYDREMKITKQTTNKLYEYQIEILKYIDLEKNEEVFVKEISKTISSKKVIIIWLVKNADLEWVVIDNIIFNPKKINF